MNISLLRQEQTIICRLDLNSKEVMQSVQIFERKLFGGGKIEDRDVNSLFDSKQSYNGSIILLQERKDIHV